MTWKQNLAQGVTEGFNFCIRWLLIINGAILALASIYLTIKLAFFTVRFLDRLLFAAPW